MRKWMITDMTHNNALITNAMLASYASEKNITYIQMIEPFIIYSLPRKTGTKIDIPKVANNVYSEFGLDIKSKVVERVLLNLSKDAANNKVKYAKEKSNYAYFVNKKMDISDFDNKREYMKSLVVEVVTCLKNYINTEKNIFKKINNNEAQNMLIDFLNNYNAVAYSNIDNIEKIQFSKDITANNFKVAEFIIHEYKNELGCFDKIKQIQEGYFASIALYNFFEDENNINKIYTLKNISIVLDTMLLIDALKLDTEYKSNSMEELLLLIKESGGTLYTFNYYVEELCGIIDKYVADPNSRISLDLDYYRRNNIGLTQIILQLTHIRDDVEKKSKIKLPNNDLEITVLPSISYDDLISANSWHIDYLKLEEIIKKNINYSSTLAFNNDCSTVQRIIYEKEFKKHDYIFLSSNYSLIFSAKKFADNQYKHLFFTDIDLTSKIWLSNYNSKSKLSELALLQNAYAALTPSKEILEDVLDIINRNMNSSDEQLKKDALLLRYDENLLYYISLVIKNDKSNININTQIELKNSLTKNIESKVDEALRAKYTAQYKEKDRQYKTLDYKNKQREEKLNKKEKDLTEKESNITAIYREKENAEILLKSKEIELNNIKNLTKNRFHKISRLISLIGSGLLIMILFVFIFAIIYYLSLFCILNIIPENHVNNIYQICTLVSFILTALSILATYFKLVRKIYRKLNSNIFRFLCRRSKIL